MQLDRRELVEVKSQRVKKRLLHFVVTQILSSIIFHGKIRVKEYARQGSV
jgi:hypothetical protein